MLGFSSSKAASVDASFKGENSTQAFAKMENDYLAPLYRPLPVVLSRGQGVTVWDVEGNSYMDFVSSLGVVNQGHCHPKIIEALVNQSQKLTMTSRIYSNDQLPVYAKLIHETFGYDRVIIMNSGAEAVETALKLARRWGYVKKGIPEDGAIVLSVEGSYHGRTLATTSLNSTEVFRKDFGPLLPGIGPQTPSGQRMRYGIIEDLERALVDFGDRVAAFIIEPVQGSGAIVPAEEVYFQAVSRLCRKYNTLLIADEVLSGCGRTGSLLAMDQVHTRADIVVMGKGMGGGVYPVSLVVADNEVMDVMDVGSHGSTFGGNPLACAVSTAAIRVLLDEKLPERALSMGALLMHGLKGLASPAIEQVGGRGLFVAVRLDADMLNGSNAFDLALLLKENGLLLYPASLYSLRLLPPLVISEEEVLTAVEKIGAALKELVSECRN